jgi:hypothetical protein
MGRLSLIVILVLEESVSMVCESAIHPLICSVDDEGQIWKGVIPTHISAPMNE